jgi:hypothetical protein
MRIVFAALMLAVCDMAFGKDSNKQPGCGNPFCDRNGTSAAAAVGEWRGRSGTLDEETNGASVNGTGAGGHA